MDETTKSEVNESSYTKTGIYTRSFPPLERLPEYDALVPGTSKHVMDLLIAQVEHRLILEKKHIEINEMIVKYNALRGLMSLIAGFIVCLACLVVGAMLITSGHDIAGTTLASANLFTLVIMFISGQKSKHNKKVRSIKSVQTEPENEPNRAD